jgi:hypothetical protein
VVVVTIIQWVDEVGEVIQGKFVSYKGSGCGHMAKLDKASGFEPDDFRVQVLVCPFSQAYEVVDYPSGLLIHRPECKSLYAYYGIRN